MRGTRVIAVLALMAMSACTGGGGPGSSPSQSPGVTVTAPASPSGTPATCTEFGSTGVQESDDPLAMSALTGAEMRVGRHDCYERFVFEMTGTGGVPGWSVQYRDPLVADPSGEVVALRGDADLEIIVRVWTVTDYEGRPAEWPPFTGPPDIVTSGFVALQEARYISAFEGVTQFGLGLDRERPFRVAWLDGPPRLALDIYTGEPLG